MMASLNVIFVRNNSSFDQHTSLSPAQVIVLAEPMDIDDTLWR